ncbi:type I secretion outer membrane protein, tolC precursor [Vibrio ishigakensis]|uniref:Type I secretion outer membrane protein, tolC n=1 Tax=Vibrio ishigakensis TaxID=1481914 RepID=A0A0B8P268_9VIBR|nr:TolC family outer membrane protein [Vibrio ishigakensis]GAM58682.1 type I secretion outer membrane protein, tolC precursor [Vibrio ishigakensis]
MIKKLFSALTLGVLTSSASAENLLDIYQQALEYDPVYRAGIAQYDADKEVYEQARSFLLPTLDLELSHTQTYQNIRDSDNPVYTNVGSDTYPTNDLTLSLTQSIYSYSNWAAFSQAEQDVKQVAAELEDVRQELILRVARAYFTVLKRRDTYLGIDAEVKSLEQLNEFVKTQGSSGLARRTDVLDAEARLLQAQARKIEIGNSLRDALQGLYELTGNVPPSLATLGEELELVRPEPFEVQTWIDNAQKNNPNIIAKQSAMEAAREDIRSQKGGHYPELDLVASYNISDTDGSLFGGGSELETADVMIRLKVPLYAGGSVSSRVRETESLFNKSRNELEQIWRQTSRETRDAFTGVTSSISKVEALNKSVEAYESAVEFKEQQFESGVTTSVTVLDAVRDLFIARTEYSAARYDYLYNNLRLKRAVGTLTEFDLEQINNTLQGKEVSTDLQVLDQDLELELSSVSAY